MAKIQLPSWHATQSKFTLPIVVLSIVAAVTFTVLLIREQSRIYYLTLATASQDGEYYAFGQALAEVVARHQPHIRIKVLETEGSQQNMYFLERHWVQLALVQSDTPVQPSIQAMALLFPEMFHLVAATEANIQSVPDLRGRRIALMPEGSGSYALFWPLVRHYNLSETDFEAIPMVPQEAHAALARGDVDALFRVIALGNPAISNLLQTGQATLLPIDQVDALQLSLPYLEATQIPKGTYNGAVPVPAADLPVVAVRSMLVTHDGIDPQVIHDITRVLYEFRSELVAVYPRAATIRLPESGENLGLALHRGARAYYNQDQPNFLVEYAEPLGLLLSITILGLSGIWQFRIWLLERQKNRADMYNLEILDLIDQVHTTDNLDQLETLRAHLFEILRRVVVDLDIDRISPESFQSFTFPWEVAITTIRHREMLLMNGLTDADGAGDASSRRASHAFPHPPDGGQADA